MKIGTGRGGSTTVEIDKSGRITVDGEEVSAAEAERRTGTRIEHSDGVTVIAGEITGGLHF
ncbi:hypothetical protein [Nocardiopsis halophila]|uniref:hypothetical protein n=1 Tax=Nocardiopsis halophila TaxID=141692 RepID=UPI000348D5EF|nr:hypothetical protein [Nocardiopsis halophila]